MIEDEFHYMFHCMHAILGGAKKRDSKKNQMKQFSLSRFEIPSKNITVF
jgi:hypothetical protein